MIKLHPHRRNHGPSRLLTVALATAFTLGVTHAQVTVPGTAAFNTGTGLYTYSYSVMNGSPTFDLAIINVPVASGGNLMNLTSPSGFVLSFDPGVGTVSFFEDADPGTPLTFSPGSTRGLFTFTSPLAPVPATFDGFDAGGNTFTGSTISPGAAVPEPGILSLLGATLVAPALLARRRRKVSESSTLNSTNN